MKNLDKKFKMQRHQTVYNGTVGIIKVMVSLVLMYYMVMKAELSQRQKKITLMLTNYGVGKNENNFHYKKNKLFSFTQYVL